MSNSQEPSYYEIALTNRQVLGFFVVLLVCVVGAFFSGVWLGQKRDSDRPMVAQAAVTAEAEDPEGELEELNFFTDSATPPPSVKPAPEPRRQAPPAAVEPAGRPDTTLLEDVGADEPTVADEERPSTREVATESPKPATAAPVASAPTASAVDGLVLQVFASPNRPQAEKLVSDLRDSGYEAFLSSAQINGQTMHRVRIGPFEDRTQAEAVKRRVDQAYRVSSFITTNE
jgi:cell division septation protein DedD